MQDLIIPAETLTKAKIDPAQFIIEIAVYLYDKRRLTFGQAKRLTGLSQIAFQKELAKRGVYLNYGVEEFEKDLKTLGL